jgi:hypothetical protein
VVEWWSGGSVDWWIGEWWIGGLVSGGLVSGLGEGFSLMEYWISSSINIFIAFIKAKDRG